MKGGGSYLPTQNNYFTLRARSRKFLKTFKTHGERVSLRIKYMSKTMHVAIKVGVCTYAQHTAIVNYPSPPLPICKNEQ